MLEQALEEIQSKDDKEKLLELLKDDAIYETINGYDENSKANILYLIEEKAKLVGITRFWWQKKKINITQVKKNNTKANVTDFENQPVQLYCGEWIANSAEGIVKYRGNQEIRVGFQPILITKRLINQENDSEKFEIMYYDLKQWKTKIIPRTMLSSNNSVIKLADYGLDITSTNASAFISYISDLYTYNKSEIPTVYSVSHLGWIGNDYRQFLPFTDGGIVCDVDGEMNKIMKLYTQKGNYKLWQDCIGECRKNNIVRIMMAASFASPLIKMTGINGFITHLYGDRGKGKTVLLMLCMSIWGAPGLGELTNSINNTLFALECRAYFLQNLPFSRR